MQEALTYIAQILKNIVNDEINRYDYSEYEKGILMSEIIECFKEQYVVHKAPHKDSIIVLEIV